MNTQNLFFYLLTAKARCGGMKKKKKNEPSRADLLTMIHALKQKKAEEAEAKIAQVVRELRGETDRSVKGLTSEMEKERARHDLAYRQLSEESRRGYDELLAEASAAHQRFRQEFKQRVRAFEAAEADEERKRGELDKAVEASRGEMNRRAAAVKTRVAGKAKRASAKIAEFQRAVDNEGSVKNLLLTLANQLQ